MISVMQKTWVLVIIFPVICVLLGFAIAKNEIVLWITAAIFLGIISSFGLRAAWEVQMAFKSINFAAAHFGGGDFKARATGVRGFGSRITHIFNSMAIRLEDLIQKIESDQVRLEIVLNTIGDPIIALSNNSDIQYLNKAALELFNTPIEIALGRPLIEVTRDYELEDLIHNSPDGAVSQQAKLITLGLDRHQYRVTSVPIGGDTEWSGLLVFVDLFSLQRTDQIRRDFVNNVSHELRTPIAAISMLSESIENDDLDEEEINDFVRRIALQISRLRLLTDELLDLSRIESGAVVLEPEVIKLTEIFSLVSENLRPLLESANVEVNYNLDSNLAVEADRSMLILIISNLIDNALRFSSDGSDIRIAVQESLSLISISVCDHGPGFPDEDKDRMFERFYKSERSRTTSGAGLGLAIVKHAVRTHGGTVQAENALDGGAIFTVRLPKRYVG